MKKINYLLFLMVSVVLIIGCKPTEDDSVTNPIDPKDTIKPKPTPEVFMADSIATTRTAVLEDFTGVRCGYCPDGHARAKVIDDANPNKFIIIATHANIYAQPAAGWANFTTVMGTAIDKQAKPAGYPAGTMNRTPCSILGTAPMNASYSNMTMGRGEWSKAATSAMNLPAPVNIGAKATYNDSTKKITVKLDLYYTADETETNNINVALLQDGLISKQSGGTPDPNKYVQNHVLRDMATGTWGVAITEPTLAKSRVKTKTFTFDVPEYYNGSDPTTGGGKVVIDNLKVVVYVTRGQKDILNAIEIDVK